MWKRSAQHAGYSRPSHVFTNGRRPAEHAKHELQEAQTAEDSYNANAAEDTKDENGPKIQARKTADLQNAKRNHDGIENVPGIRAHLSSSTQATKMFKCWVRIHSKI